MEKDCKRTDCPKNVDGECHAYDVDYMTEEEKAAWKKDLEKFFGREKK